eukprot:189975-Pleurochrysis_carterae.AAC.2
MWSTVDASRSAVFGSNATSPDAPSKALLRSAEKTPEPSEGLGACANAIANAATQSYAYAASLRNAADAAAVCSLPAPSVALPSICAHAALLLLAIAREKRRKPAECLGELTKASIPSSKLTTAWRDIELADALATSASVSMSCARTHAYPSPQSDVLTAACIRPIRSDGSTLANTTLTPAALTVAHASE